jgi:hypothetical protein
MPAVGFPILFPLPFVVAEEADRLKATASAVGAIVPTFSTIGLVIAGTGARADLIPRDRLRGN